MYVFLCTIPLLFQFSHQDSCLFQLLIKLEDNRLVETVGIPVEDDKGSLRLTACVSSQVMFHAKKNCLLGYFISLKELLYALCCHVSYCLFHLVDQVGCPLRCSFCATGKGGFSRNLKSHEIVEQVSSHLLLCNIGIYLYQEVSPAQ